MAALLLLVCLTQNTDGLTELKQALLENDRAVFAAMLAPKGRVNTDLRPLLRDHGNLGRDQAVRAFDKLQDRYLVRSLRVVNSQSDTNYAWLEIFLRLELEDRDDGARYSATFAFQFKITAAHMAVSHWVLQDLG